MSQPYLTQTNKQVVEPKGLKDAGHIIMRCSACNKPLVDIWRTKPDRVDPRTGKPFEWKFIAKCCYCQDTSYLVTVSGGIHIGGYGINTRDANESYEKTTIISEEPMPGDNNVTLITTARCK